MQGLSRAPQASDTAAKGNNTHTSHESPHMWQSHRGNSTASWMLQTWASHTTKLLVTSCCMCQPLLQAGCCTVLSKARDQLLRHCCMVCRCMHCW